MTTLKKPIFIGFFWFFSIFFFFFFLFLFFQHKKGKTKNAIFFSKTSFLTSPKFCKNTILTHCCTICVSKNAQKHYKNGENSEKNLDHFLTLNLDHFLTLKPPNLGPLFNRHFWEKKRLHSNVEHTGEWRHTHTHPQTQTEWGEKTEKGTKRETTMDR